jgi:hypothetical protein
MRTLTFVLAFTVAAASANAASPRKPVSLLKSARAWIGTGADNSLVHDPALFQFGRDRTGRVLRTDSGETNIHAHYAGRGSEKFNVYTYSGEMRIADEDAGIGITFYSDYTRTDTYYRLRRYGDEPAFHIAAHGTEMETGTCRSDVAPLPNAWYAFKVMVTHARTHIRARAKVWRRGTAEPKAWQIDCRDVSGDRIFMGRPGVWSSGPGRKEWRKLQAGPNR